VVVMVKAGPGPGQVSVGVSTVVACQAVARQTMEMIAVTPAAARARMPGFRTRAIVDVMMPARQVTARAGSISRPSCQTERP
jgi:hypothetical protein